MANVLINNITDTWNSAGTTFTGIKFNVTDTASASGSLLMDLQVGGTSKFKVAKAGDVTFDTVLKSGALNITQTWPAAYGVYDGIFYHLTNVGGADTDAYVMRLRVASTDVLTMTRSGKFAVTASISASSISSATISTQTDGVIATSGANSYMNPAGANGARLYGDAAHVLAQRNGVNAQTSRLYGTYTDVSNYRRLTKTMSAAGVAEIKPEGAGTGATGNVLYISGLPTSNPGPGILWNDAGTVKVGT